MKEDGILVGIKTLIWEKFSNCSTGKDFGSGRPCTWCQRSFCY